jgi:N-hydroxyarylamine O-acetyltransferase
MSAIRFSDDGAIPAELQERVLSRLGFGLRLEPSFENLRSIYAAWCQRVPFDNVRKLIHMRRGNSGAMPGGTPPDFFEAWLRHGTGGTCWAGAGALQALLSSLGFAAERAIATMLVAPDLPPNHGSVRVSFDGMDYLVDSGMLHGEPLRLDGNSETHVNDPAWGLRCSRSDGRWLVRWRPLHKTDGLDCRFESFGASLEDYVGRYEKTRGWSPFNYELTARRNCGDRVVGVAFGKVVSLEADGSVRQTPSTAADRVRVLIEDIGLSEEIVSALPPDVPTPPPPWSQTAQAASASAS